MTTEMLFSGWAPLVRTLAVGACAYVALILILRSSGKRTLSKMNAFDLVVTVALGSTLASILTSKEVSLAQGVVALALLVGLQFGITWLSVRLPRVHRLARSEPTLLAYRGQALDEVMQCQRISRAELDAALRGAGVSDLSAVHAVVLESDGSLSVVRT